MSISVRDRRSCFGYFRVSSGASLGRLTLSAIFGHDRWRSAPDSSRPETIEESRLSLVYDRKWTSIIPPNRPNVVSFEGNVENAKVGQPFSEKQEKKIEFPSVRSKYRTRNSFRPGTKGWTRYKARDGRSIGGPGIGDMTRCKFRIVDLSTAYILPFACLNQREGLERKFFGGWRSYIHIYIYIDVINRIGTVERERKIGCIKRHKRTIMI